MISNQSQHWSWASVLGGWGSRPPDFGLGVAGWAAGWVVGGRGRVVKYYYILSCTLSNSFKTFWQCFAIVIISKHFHRYVVTLIKNILEAVHQLTFSHGCNNQQRIFSQMLSIFIIFFIHYISQSRFLLLKHSIDRRCAY